MLESRGGVINRRVAVDFTLAAQLQGIVSGFGAFGANIAGWKYFVSAMMTDLTMQAVTLFFNSPISGNVHKWKYSFHDDILDNRYTV